MMHGLNTQKENKKYKSTNQFQEEGEDGRTSAR